MEQVKSFHLLSTQQGFLNTYVCLKKTIKSGGPITVDTQKTDLMSKALDKPSSEVIQHKPVENSHSYQR